MVRVIGIDPGLANTGWGIIETDGTRFRYINHGTISTKSNIPSTIRLKEIYNKYSDIIDFSLPKDQRKKDGNRMAIFNSAKYLEIAMYRSNCNTVGSAYTLLGLNYRDVITIKFY